MSPSVLRSHSLPSVQKAYVSNAYGGTPELTTIDVPEYSRDEVLVKLKFSAVSSIDLHAWKERWPAQPKQSLVGGHEGTGIVIAVGTDVADISVGDRVGIPWINRSCGICEFCSRGARPLCLDIEVRGYTVNGTHQQYCVCKAEDAVRLPSDIALDKAASVLSASGTVHKALKECNVKQGQHVAIAGADGAIGTFACQFAKACGYNVQTLPSSESEGNICNDELHINNSIDIAPYVMEEFKSSMHERPSAVLVLSTATNSFDQAIQYVRPGGTVIAVGLLPGCMRADMSTVILRNIRIKGSSCLEDRQEAEEALDIISQSGVEFPYDVLQFQELPKNENTQTRTVLRIPEDEVKSHSIIPITPGQTQPHFNPTHYNLGTRLAYRLEELGVTEYFAVPGDFNLDLLDQVLKNKALRMVGCCNELNAGYAADGYARSSPGRVAVVFATFMVGGLSLINAIAGAYSEGLRVVVISGCPPQKTFGQDRLIHHTLGTTDRDQALRMFKEVTARSVRLNTEHGPAETLDNAICHCLEASLPVYIELPSDIAQAACEAPSPLQTHNLAHWQISETETTINAIADIWNAAKRPVLIIGARVRRTVRPDVLVSLIEKMGCAVLVQPDAKSLVPEDQPQFLGTFWSSASEPVCETTVSVSDLWVMVGCRWTDYHTLGSLDIARESHRVVDLQDRLVTLPDGNRFEGIALNELIRELAQSGISHNDATRADAPGKAPVVNGVARDNSKLSVSSILRGIQEIVKPGDAILADTGDSWFNAQSIKLPRGADYQMQIVYGSIGWSLPATLGYRLGRPESRVILMIGDGSFQMTCQEVSTMIRMRLNPIILVFNNLGYAIETAIHDGPYNYYTNWNYASLVMNLSGTFHAVYENPHFDHAVAESSSSPRVFSAQIKTNTDLMIALTRAEQEPEKLAFLECCIEPSDISPSLRRFGAAIGGGK